MQLRPCDILPLVKARAKDHPYELRHLKRELNNKSSNLRRKEEKRYIAVVAAIEGDFKNCHHLAKFLGFGFNDVSVTAWLRRYI